jgi:hypothetical protein
MESSRRIALPLAIALHILLFFLLSRQSVVIQPIQKAGRSMTLQLLPLFEPKAKPPPTPTMVQPSIHHQETTSSDKRKSQAASQSPVVGSAIPAVPEAEVSKESANDGQSALSDPAALVRSYSYENSKSDLQKAIESHGGTVALTKGKYDDFHEQMDFATIPGCLNSDGLKHDPPKIGPVSIGGLPVLLFLAHAAATGKCKLPGAN